jgi:hypothetical protein
MGSTDPANCDGAKQRIMAGRQPATSMRAAEAEVQQNLLPLRYKVLFSASDTEGMYSSVQ